MKSCRIGPLLRVNRNFLADFAINIHHFLSKAALPYTCSKTKVEMRKLYLLLTVVLLSLSSCAVKLPPGQAKKVTPAKAAPGQVKKTTGSQSAAPYAPGQQKKAAPASAPKKKN